MKYVFFSEVIIVLLLTISSCSSDKDKGNSSTIDSLKKQLIEYKKQDLSKNDQIVQLYNQFQKFGMISDSIKKRENKIDSLKIAIKQKGFATPSDNRVLNNLLTQINKFLDDNKALASELDSMGIRSKDPSKIIAILLSSIEDKQRQMNYMKSDIAQLQKQVKGIQLEKKSLEVENVKLSTKVDTLSKSIDKAKKLIISDIAFSFPTTIIGGTKKAKKIDKIKICYTIHGNELIANGNKTVYVRIVLPNGDVLFNSANDLFSNNGKSIAYTLKKDFYYSGTKYTDCFEWVKAKQSLQTGNHVVSFFVDGQLIDTKEFKLE